MRILETPKAYYRKYSAYTPVAFFVAGFVFDAIMLHRIDEPMVLVQQAIYIVLSAVLINVELFEHISEVHPPFLLRKVWRFREPFLHFMLGTLLNSYTIFYFKSASALTSFIFIIMLVGLLILNEFKRFGESQTIVHFGFLGLSIISYLVCLVPIMIGFVGYIPFIAANFLAFGVFFLYFRYMQKRLPDRRPLIRSHIVIPFLAVQLLFVGLYFAHVIPPVPLSVTHIGIYHDIKKKNGEYELTYTRSKWKFWQHGDQSFYARPGDVIHCFVQVFSPGGFKDKLQMHWYYKDPRVGWQSAGAKEMAITGGREEGFRFPGRKENYTPGDWRVAIETLEGREVGRIGFTVEKDESTDPLEPKTEML